MLGTWEWEWEVVVGMHGVVPRQKRFYFRSHIYCTSVLIYMYRDGGHYV